MHPRDPPIQQHVTFTLLHDWEEILKKVERINIMLSPKFGPYRRQLSLQSLLLRERDRNLKKPRTCKREKTLVQICTQYNGNV